MYNIILLLYVPKCNLGSVKHEIKCWPAVFPPKVGMWGGQGLHTGAHVFTAQL